MLFLNRTPSFSGVVPETSSFLKRLNSLGTARHFLGDSESGLSSALLFVNA